MAVIELLRLAQSTVIFEMVCKEYLNNCTFKISQNYFPDSLPCKHIVLHFVTSKFTCNKISMGGMLSGMGKVMYMERNLPTYHLLSMSME
jgi:hypothetical protein